MIEQNSLRYRVNMIVGKNYARDVLEVELVCTTHSNLVLEWNYEKNVNKIPESYSKGSEEKVWWKCELGHE